MRALMKTVMALLDTVEDSPLAVGPAPARHFLDAIENPGQVTPTEFLEHLMGVTGITMYRLATVTGIHQTVLYAVLRGSQKSLYPDNQERLKKALSGYPALLEEFKRVDWGKDAPRRTR